jgi:hypothetical protein
MQKASLVSRHPAVAFALTRSTLFPVRPTYAMATSFGIHFSFRVSRICKDRQSECFGCSLMRLLIEHGVAWRLPNPA